MRTSGSTAFTLAVAILLLALPACVHANGPEIGRNAGSVFPLATEKIQLVEETVMVRLPGSGRVGRAECRYVLRNLTGAPQNFEMGFLTGASWPQADENNRPAFALRLRVSRDRRTIPVSMAALDRARWVPLIANPPDSIPVWSVSIEPRADAELWISYDVSWSGGGDGRSRSLEFTYHAKPAAAWAGKVEKATITFALDDGLTAVALACLPDSASCIRREIRPAGYRWTGYGLRWDLADWEPAEDFHLGLSWTESD